MRIDILTFHAADNCGAMLQAYALQTKLEQFGHDAGFADYMPPGVAWTHWIFPYFPSRSRLNLPELRKAYRRFKHNLRNRQDFIARQKNMRAFREQRLHMHTPRLRSAQQLCKLQGDMLILGSDQIWNPELTDGLQSAYYGAYRGQNTRRIISYAASMGSSRIPSKYEPRFRELLQNLDTISVREKGALPFLKDLGLEACAAVDPTLLLDASNWAAIATPPPMKDAYIYVYLFEKNDKLDSFVDELKRRTGLPVVMHRVRIERDWPLADVQDFTAGPAEFLGAIRHARYVVTNSFHGTAFATIFHRPFVSIPHSTRGLRMLDLLDDLGLSDRVLREGLTVDIDASVDWNAVDARRAALTAESEAFLLRELAACEERR